MLSTEFGIVTEVKLEQSMKALFPILLTELPIFKDVKFSHNENAFSSIRVTEFGIVIDVRLVQKQYLLLVDYQYYTL